MTITAHDALQQLEKGNRRFVEGRMEHPHQSHERRRDLRDGQHPFAVILGCADSRIPPEIIFDQGLGDLFVIRVAGNIVDDGVLGSLEYAVEHLGVPLIVILGHEGCGAVTAAFQGAESNGSVGHVLEAIRPAVEEVRSAGKNTLKDAIHCHTHRMAREIRRIFAQEIDHHGLHVVEGYYHLVSGEVTF